MSKNRNINRLIIANISKSRMTEISQELVNREFYYTRIDASGGLLQGSTNTLLIGISHERMEELKELLREYCQRRITHIPTPTQIEAFGQYNQPMIIEAETGGATIHTIPVEYFEQF